MEKPIKLILFLSEFVKSTIYGQESGMYKLLSKNHQDVLLGMQLSKMMEIQLDALETYFNLCYDDLVTGDDPYINEKFDEMQSIMNHSPVCLITMLAVMCTSVYIRMDRTTFDISSYKEYMMSVSSECNKRISEVIKSSDMPNKINHVCNSPKKAPAPEEGEKIFVFGMNK